ncbi:MAG: sugar-binding transcriptional regulator [Janthinobacterium lividum]
MDSALEALRSTIAARRYYVDGATKSAIADELRISRFKVARLIDRAVKDGIITFTVNEPAGVNVESSTRLAAHLGIPECVVVPVVSTDDRHRTQGLGRASAGILAELLDDGQLLGITWGRTLRTLVDALRDVPKVQVVQLVGGIVSGPLEFSPADLIRTLASRTAGQAHPLHAPLLADSAESAATIRAETSIAATMSLFTRLDRAVVGIGSWTGDGSALRAALPADVVAACLRAGVVADVGTTLIGDGGEILDVAELGQRAIGATTTQLRSVPDVTAVAGGPDRARAITAACRTGLIHRLVTDDVTARRLLDETRR